MKNARIKIIYINNKLNLCRTILVTMKNFNNFKIIFFRAKSKTLIFNKKTVQVLFKTPREAKNVSRIIKKDVGIELLINLRNKKIFQITKKS